MLSIRIPEGMHFIRLPSCLKFTKLKDQPEILNGLRLSVKKVVFHENSLHH